MSNREDIPVLVWICRECGATFDHNPDGGSHGTIQTGACDNTGGFSRGRRKLSEVTHTIGFARWERT